jgi:hypothetical protein
MKTVTLNADNQSILIAEDLDTMSVESNHVVRNVERIYGIGADTVTLHEGVDVPADWVCGKYLFDGVEWAPNPSWVDFTPSSDPQE